MTFALYLQAVVLASAPSAVFWLIGGGLVFLSLQLRRLATPKPLPLPHAVRRRGPV